MYRYNVKRLLLVIPTLVVAAALVFLLMRLIPGKASHHSRTSLQATQCPGRNSRSSGRSCLHFSTAIGQRG